VHPLDAADPFARLTEEQKAQIRVLQDYRPYVCPKDINHFKARRSSARDGAGAGARGRAAERTRKAAKCAGLVPRSAFAPLCEWRGACGSPVLRRPGAQVGSHPEAALPAAVACQRARTQPVAEDRARCCSG